MVGQKRWSLLHVAAWSAYKMCNMTQEFDTKLTMEPQISALLRSNLRIK